LQEMAPASIAPACGLERLESNVAFGWGEGLTVKAFGGWPAALAVVALASCETPHKHYTGPLIATPQSCADIAFPVYFDPGSANLTPQAEQLIASAHKRSVGCSVTGVDVVGLADAVGAPGANLALSERRADSVTKALGRNGFAKAPVRVAAAGAAEATVAGGEAKPLRRRADVTIRLSPGPPAPSPH
jgi:peptidoglycan-associated lipoprotein